jgi:copper(I)-binding protein
MVHQGLRLAPVAALALVLAACKAGDPPQISVDNAWARASVGPQASSAAYFTIRNGGGADALLSVSAPGANASLHSTAMDNGVMRMRPLEKLEVPANSTVELKPGGTHVMLMGLSQPLVAGSTVQLDLKFEHSPDKVVSATVKPATANGMAM